jgi:thioredoxin 1
MGGNVITVSSGQAFQAKLQEAKNARKAAVVDFFAVWCGPCKMTAPYFEQMSTKYKNVMFLKVDVDQCQDVASNCGIRAMPTFQVFYDGKKIHEVVGGNIPELEKIVQEYDKKGGTFQGAAHTLSGNSTPAAPAAAAAGAPDHFAQTGADTSKPTTNIQIRLADGNKLKGTFNMTQTVGDIRRFIHKATSSSGSYQLLTQYPTKVLTDDADSIQQAELQNALLIQKA